MVWISALLYFSFTGSVPTVKTCTAPSAVGPCRGASGPVKNARQLPGVVGSGEVRTPGSQARGPLPAPQAATGGARSQCAGSGGGDSPAESFTNDSYVVTGRTISYF